MPDRPLSADSPVGSICIVATELAYLSAIAGIGTAHWSLAHCLARHGWRVHILCTFDPESDAVYHETAKRLDAAGIQLTLLRDLCQRQPLFYIPCADELIEVGERVLIGLRKLHAQHGFDIIEFSEWAGMGFRPVQAKQSGLAFDHALTLVKLHGSHQWVRTGNHIRLAQPNNVVRDFSERYSFDNADIQCSPCHSMLEHARSVGWNVRSDAQVIPFAMPDPVPGSVHGPGAGNLELVFFGPLETRGGLDLFVQAVRELPVDIPVTFLGKDAMGATGLSGVDFIRANLDCRPLALLTDLDHEQAMGYLRAGNRLAVIPSLAESYPGTVIDCTVNGVPFLATSASGVLEVISDPKLQEALLFRPTTPDLVRALRRVLQRRPAELVDLRDRIRDLVDVSSHNRLVAREYSQLLARRGRKKAPSPHAQRVPAKRPHVSVVVTYYNLGEFLPETLQSLQDQTYPDMDVLVIDDGSTCDHDIRIFEQQRMHYPRFRFVRQENMGLGAARNRGLHEAQGEYFVPVDADNVARPRMIERFVEAMERNPEASAYTCFYHAFRHTEDIARGAFVFDYRPLGGPRAWSCLENVFGDANAVFRTAHLRAVGGYSTDPSTTLEDWELFAKLLNAGYRVDVIPEYLFYYRCREGSLVQRTSPWLNHERVLREVVRGTNLSLAERHGLWALLTTLLLRTREFERDASRLEDHNLQLKTQNALLSERLAAIRYRLVDKLALAKYVVPTPLRPLIRSLAKLGWTKRSLGEKSSTDSVPP
ncbi:MAG: glycosyltransferase [Gemmataceae bacterium]|nr:glycosyltransferase [Gemmataceae bacterium]